MQRLIGFWRCGVLLLALSISACIGPPLVLAPQELPGAIQGRSYQTQLTTDGMEPESWRLSSGALPAGLSLSGNTGAITGTPQEAGTFFFDVTVQDSSVPPRTGTATYAITVVPRLTLDAQFAPARVGEFYTDEPTATGGVPPYQFSVIGLPAGMTFNMNTGAISGAPLTPNPSVPLQVAVTDSGDPQQTVTRSITLQIKAAAVRIVDEPLPNGNVNAPYSATLTALQGQPPLRWAVIEGFLGDDLRLNTVTGVISGTPETARTITFVVQVTDADLPPSTDTQEFTITIEE